MIHIVHLGLTICQRHIHWLKQTPDQWVRIQDAHHATCDVCATAWHHSDDGRTGLYDLTCRFRRACEMVIARALAENRICHCGMPLHYSSRDVERDVDRIIALLGPDIPVTGPDGRTWKVPRHYIALHGINADTLHEQGFELALRD